MRYSQAFIPTLKEDPADAQVASHVYLIRGGFIRKAAAGIYSFLPLGWRVIHKIEAIVRSELDRAGAQEVLLPAATPAELWQETGRWQKYGPELLRFKDRKGADFCFGPTHEEVITDIVRGELKSYRELPVTLYQIQGKFRDEIRPRAGLLRGREFIMKDAYSFHSSAAQAFAEYDNMFAAYERIFRRCGLEFRAVEADTGAIGGSRSHEFQVLAASGEDSLVACDRCDYAANVEEAEVAVDAPGIVGDGSLEEIATPGVRTIDEVAAFLGVSPAALVKTLIYIADGEPVAVLLRGDRSLNEIKLKRLLGARELFLAREGQVVEATGVKPGFAGPVGLSIPIVADSELEGASGAMAGANKVDTHVRGLDLRRDLETLRFAPLRAAEAGDRCPRCEGHFESQRGIEVGHVFYLGTVYTDAMGCTFLDETGAQKAMEMGCYGIGITRVAAAAIEQNHDKGGIVWPMTIAPFEVEILPLQADDEVGAAAKDLYEGLLRRGIDVLLDDRDERPGGKFKDADLIGIPLRIAIGRRSLGEGNVELKWRRDSEASLLPLEGAVDAIAELVTAEKARLAA